MDRHSKIFVFDSNQQTEEEPPVNPKPSNKETKSEKMTLFDHISGSTEGTIVGIIVLICSLIYFYWSTKGMCRFTRGDGFFMTIIKHLINYLTAGIVGVTSCFIQTKEVSKPK